MEPFAIEVRSTTYILKENLEEACSRLQKTEDEGLVRKQPSLAAELLRRHGFDADLCLDGAVWFGGYVGRSIHAGERILERLEDLIEPGGIAAWIDTEGHSYIDRFDGRQMKREDPYEQYMNLKPAHELQGNDIRAWYRNRYPQDTLAVYLKGGVSFKDVAQAMLDGKDFYSLIADDPYSVDTLVRERIFEGMAEKLDISYDAIYELWLNPENYPERDWEKFIAEEKDCEGLATRSEDDLKQDGEER